MRPPRDKFSPPKNREKLVPLAEKTALKRANLMINFPIFSTELPFSEPNYAILYGKSAEKGHFFTFFLHNKCKLCVIKKKVSQKAPRKRQKTLGNGKSWREKQRKNLTPEKRGWGIN